MKTTELPVLSDDRINKIAALLVSQWVCKDPTGFTNSLVGDEFRLGVERSREVFQNIAAPAMFGQKLESPELLDKDDPRYKEGTSTILVELLRIRGVTLDANFINFVRIEAADLPMVDWLELLVFYHQVVIGPIINDYTLLHQKFELRDVEVD